MTANSSSVYIDNESITIQNNFVINSTGILLNDGGFSLNETNGFGIGNSSLGSNGLVVGNSSLGTNGILTLGNSVLLGNGQFTIGNSFTINTTTLLIGNSFTDASLNSTILTIGNSTVNVTINSTSFSGSVNVNTSGYALLTGAQFSGQINVGANLNLSTTKLLIGNSTVNTTLNNSTLFLGNSTQNCSINSSSFAVANDAVFGEQSNGSVSLPGGLIINWGFVNTNSSGATATFHTAYQINAFSVMCSPTTGGGGVNVSSYPYVANWSKTGADIATTNASATFPCLYFAIGI